MTTENESTIRDAAGPSDAESPAKSPAEVPALSRRVRRAERALEEKLPGCFVYLIQAGNMVKVGISNNPWSRMSTLQTATPERLVLAYLVYFNGREMARRVEAAVHKRLASRRRSGEWFCIDVEAAVETTTRASNQIQRHRKGDWSLKVTMEELLEVLDAIDRGEAEWPAHWRPPAPTPIEL